ncbi:MAG: DEAD/DEAH box helicase family protein [Pseudomonadota bacterium]
MRRLSELTFKTAYHKGRDHIARDFYLPSMERATQLDRAVAYFRSTAFIISWPALRSFVADGGRYRILCSQVLAESDIEALNEGYSGRVDQELAAKFRAEVDGILADPVLRAPARVLAALVAKGTLELQIAVLSNQQMRAASGRIFHDKLGIFRDSFGNRVMFKGSMNETWNGLSADGNLESVDVAASWMGPRDLERTNLEDAYFEELWTRNYPGVIVRAFPEVAREEFVKAADPNWEETVDALLSAEQGSTQPDARGRVLKSHQASGLASWEANGRRGILAFATGAGKTFTAITAIRDSFARLSEPVMIVVPDRTLFAQWYDELVETTADFEAQILRAGAGHSRWRGHVRSWLAPSDRHRIVLATVQTASSADFLSEIPTTAETFIVADEVHRLGSPKYRDLLDDERFGARLGLSATPERYGDPEGTAALLGFFGGVLEPRYTLEDAIRDNVLTPYFYRPHTVRLTQDEADSWQRLSADAARLRARINSGDPTPGLAQKLQNRLIARARIVKHASAKIGLAADVLRREYENGQRWLVYCEDSGQLAAVTAALSAQGQTVLPYHSAMDGDREQTLRWLSRRGGIVTAIRCLDEGVDIPAVTHALILASSRNPREFVQRRGRVLRKADGKALAFVHDAIVLPPAEPAVVATEDEADHDSLTTGELIRAIEFAQFADNPASAADLKAIALTAGIDWRRLTGLGEEDVDE